MSGTVVGRQAPEAEANDTNPAQAEGAKARRGPRRFLESRTCTVPGAAATSTQESPSGPLL